MKTDCVHDLSDKTGEALPCSFYFDSSPALPDLITYLHPHAPERTNSYNPHIYHPSWINRIILKNDLVIARKPD